MRQALVLAVALATTFAASVARAGDDDTKANGYHAVVDRVDLEPAAIGGLRLRVYLSALTIQGQLLDLTDPKSVRLYLGTSEKKFPFALGTYDQTNGDTDIVVLVQATADFQDALALIGESLEHTLLDHIADRYRVAIVMYGEAAQKPKLTTAKLQRGKVALSSDGSVADPVLSDAIVLALNLLKKPPPPKPSGDGKDGAAPAPANQDAPVKPRRKMIIVIGDGRDAAADRDRVTHVGMRAAKEGVRIHTLAYSPADLRRPLLVLGELSKRSQGTFRWPGQGRKPGPDSWNDAFKQLADEINKQNVITFFVGSDDDIAGKKLHVGVVGRFEVTSSEQKVGNPECAGAACDTGYCADDQCLTPSVGGGSGGKILKWVLIVAGCAVGAIVLLGFIGFLMTKRQERAAAIPIGAHMPAGMAHPTLSPQLAAQQGLLPNGRPIPGLLIIAGPRAGERRTLRNGFTIGKQPGSDLVFDDGYTSTNHAQITMDPSGNCALYDLGSTNGTFVNGNRITQMPLTHGCEIKIGSTTMRYLTQ